MCKDLTYQGWVDNLIYTNGQKKGYTEYMSDYSLVNLKHSMFLT